MVKSKGNKPATPEVRESKRTHKPKLIYDPSDLGEQHSTSKAAKSKASETGTESSTIASEGPANNLKIGIKKSISKTSKVSQSYRLPNIMDLTRVFTACPESVIGAS